MNFVPLAKIDKVFSLKKKNKKIKMILEKSGNSVSPEKWEPRFEKSLEKLFLFM